MTLLLTITIGVTVGIVLAWLIISNFAMVVRVISYGLGVGLVLLCICLIAAYREFFTNVAIGLLGLLVVGGITWGACRFAEGKLVGRILRAKGGSDKN